MAFTAEWAQELSSYICAMLGLGIGAHLGGGVVDDPTYFSFGMPGYEAPDPAWEEYSVEGGLAITYNETAPDGTTGCLKGVYDTDQTDNSGIRLLDIVDSSVVTNGDNMNISFDIYIFRELTAPYSWDFYLGQVSTTFQLLGKSISRFAYANNWTTMSFSTTVSNTSGNDFLLRWATNGQLPNEGGTFWIKNFSVSLSS